MDKKHKNLFGPISSRRLGRSLGVDPIGSKTCSLDCIYCEVGKTDNITCERKVYISAEDILAQIKDYLDHHDSNIDFITFSGLGEPTLNSELGKMIAGIKKISDVKVAVITNSTLLDQKQVRDELLLADIVMPSLDSAQKQSFIDINRPAKTVKLDTIIEGLIAFRKEYKGQIWLEIFFVEGINDSKKDIEVLVQAVKKINPDKIQINSLARPGAESWVKPMSAEKLAAIAEKFGEHASVVLQQKILETVPRVEVIAKKIVF